MNATKIYNRKLTALLAATVAALAMAIIASPASAALEIESFDGRVLKENGDPQTQAGGRPHSAETEFFFPSSNGLPVESLKDARVELPPGFVGNPQSQEICTQEQFVRRAGFSTFDSCPTEAQIGYVELFIKIGPTLIPFGTPLLNLEAPRGTPGVFGFQIAGTPAYITAEVRTGDDYGLNVANLNAPATLAFVGLGFHFWGVPADPAHDGDRGYDSEGNPCVFVFTPPPARTPLLPPCAPT